MNEQHKMVLEMTNESGLQGWYCPTCGRRILVVPEYNKMVVVDVGDQYAVHRGSVGGLHISAVQLKERDDDLEEITEESLRPWIEALEKMDLDW